MHDEVNHLGKMYLFAINEKPKGETKSHLAFLKPTLLEIVVVVFF